MKDSRINIDLVQRNTNRGDRERTLGLFDLSILGIGAIIGTGILVLTGIVAATDAGPGVAISFVIAAVASCMIGLCYSELTTSIPNSGSAYVYAWVAIGQRIAFLAGWTLIGVYITTTATVANGWTGYVKSFFKEIGVTLPHALLASPFDGGLINLPALIMICLMTFVLTRGTSESKWINNVMVIVKLAVICLFIVMSITSVQASNWRPFLPYGIQGVFTGAATVFFTFLGFDALATSAEEVKNVKKNLPRAIILSLIVSTTLYVIVSLIMTGVVHYTELNVPESMAYVLISQGHHLSAQLVSVGAILGITAVVYAFVYAASNITMAMSRGGFLPKKISVINVKTKSPNRALWLIGGVAATLAGFINIKHLAVIANVGSLSVFFLISLIVIILRHRQPDLKRPFKLPFGDTIPIFSMLICGFLLLNTPLHAWIIYTAWLLIGFIVYLLYSRKHVDIEQREEQEALTAENQVV